MVPFSSTRGSSVMSAWSKAPVRLVAAMYLPSFASIAHEIMMATSDTFGKLVSALALCFLCDCPSAQPLAIIFPYCFYYRNIRYLSSLFCSLYVMSSLPDLITPHCTVPNCELHDVVITIGILCWWTSCQFPVSHLCVIPWSLVVCYVCLILHVLD